MTRKTLTSLSLRRQPEGHAEVRHQCHASAARLREQRFGTPGDIPFQANNRYDFSINMPQRCIRYSQAFKMYYMPNTKIIC